MATVVIVPGFGGSKLLSEPSFLFGTTEYWLSPFVLAQGRVFSLRLSDDGLRPYYPGAATLVAGGRIDYYYPPMEGYLSARGWQPVWAASDWRQPIDDDARGLAQLLAAVGNPDPVRVVCHSRGGLLVQAACQLLAARGTLGAVRQVIAVCCPFGGSYCPMPFLAGSILGQPGNKGIWAAVGVLDSVPFISSIFRDICKSFPGLYELMPNPALADANGDPDTSLLYSDLWWARSNVPVINDWLRFALQRWQSAPSWPAGLRVDNIVGTGIPTPGPYVHVLPPRRPWSVGTPVDGDGTVPTWSASIGGRTTQTFPVGHNESLRDARVLGAIDSLLRS